MKMSESEFRLYTSFLCEGGFHFDYQTLDNIRMAVRFREGKSFTIPTHHEVIEVYPELEGL